MAEKRCCGCMKLKTESPICEHCGYNENIDNEPHQLPCGTVLRGQYMIGKVLGQGGFGITYLGWDLLLETPIAIKEYYPNGLVTREAGSSLAVTAVGGSMHSLFENSRERFLREAKALARFGDVPEIVRVFNFFEENDTAYIIMEYVKGIDLRRYINLRGGKLSVEETFRILKPVMEALSIVHREGLVHRDISPDNIMILPRGGAKLLDFGAVRGVENADVDKMLSRSTEAILKHGFAPMEQYQKRGSLGPWTDVYALCATIYYCLTGTVPPDAPARMMEEVDPDWQSIPGLTDHQKKVLETGMALRAKDRIPSVDELYGELFAEADPQPAPAPKPIPEPLPEPVPKPAPEPVRPQAAPAAVKTESRQKQKKRRFGGVLGVLLAVVLALGGGIWLAANSDILSDSGKDRAPEGDRVLMADFVDETSMRAVAGAMKVFGSQFRRDQIRTVTFQSSLEDLPESAWDVSELRNGSVMAWVEADNDGYYNLYIAADGGVVTPEFCDYIFCGYENVRSIDFGDSVFTDNTVSMRGMFAGCSSLTALELGDFSTEMVTDMSEMFCECTSLVNVEFGSFSTARVTNMRSMFQNCRSLAWIDVSHFDTSAVTVMTNMFYGCENLEDVDVTGFNTDNVEYYLHFMDEGKLVNGGSWEKLFD